MTVASRADGDIAPAANRRRWLLRRLSRAEIRVDHNKGVKGMAVWGQHIAFNPKVTAVTAANRQFNQNVRFRRDSGFAIRAKRRNDRDAEIRGRDSVAPRFRWHATVRKTSRLAGRRPSIGFPGLRQKAQGFIGPSPASCRSNGSERRSYQQPRGRFREPAARSRRLPTVRVAPFP